MSAPPIRLPDSVRNDLNGHQPGLAEEFERTLATHVRPCVAVTATRVSTRPLRRNPVARLFGGLSAPPVLGALESKFGGTPYSEADEDWSEHRFLGQIDLASATAVLPPEHMNLNGLLRIDYCPTGGKIADAVRVRWFPQPSLGRAVSARPRSVGAWEGRLSFALGWTLPEGNALESLWPLREPKWSDYDTFFPEGYNADGFDAFHRLLGHKSGGLDEPYGFTPPPECSADVASYECLLRLTFDNAAGFAWGSNWIYLIVPREDLARGDLSRVVATAGNA